LSIIAGIAFAVFTVYSYADEHYSFNVFGFGSLSLIPPALVSLGFFAIDYRGKDYWDALRNNDLDILISLGLAAIAFVWILILISRRTNLWIALFTMLVMPSILIIAGIIFVLIAIGEAEMNRSHRR